MNKAIKVLIVEDSKTDAKLLTKELRTGGLIVSEKIVDSLNDFNTCLDSFKPDLILADYNLSGFDGLDVFNALLKSGKDIPFIIISGVIDEETAVKLMDLGVNDYLMKHNIMRMIPAIKRELKEAEIRKQLRIANDKLKIMNDLLGRKVEDRTSLLQELNEQLIKENKERLNKEVELLETKNYLYRIIENIPSSVYVKDANSLAFNYINKAFEDLTGYSRNDIIGKTVYEIFEKETADEIVANDYMLLKDNKPLDIREINFKTKNGEIKHLYQRKILLKDEHGCSKNILGMAEDLTERKRFEKELENTELRLSVLLKYAPVAIIIESYPDSIILNTNNSFDDLLGYSNQEIIGLSSKSMNFWKYPEELENIINSCIRHGSIKDKEIIMQKKDGTYITVVLSLNYIQFDDTSCLLFMFNDITKKKEAEEEIYKALEKERELNILKSRLISMVSHEFRTPLTTIILSTDMLKRYSSNWDSSEKNKHFDRIQQTVLSMTKLMENVLTVGRLETGKFEFHPEPIDLPAYCQTLSESIEFATSHSNPINYTFSGESVDIKADENLLGLIITNLLNNAVKYSRKAEPIKFDVTCSDNQILIEITDKGIGIPKEDIKHLFDSFYRATNVGGVAGYGLGLAIVKKCVDSHNGTIEVDSIVNEGTTFRITLPA